MGPVLYTAVLTAINLVVLWVGYHLILDDDQPEEE